MQPLIIGWTYQHYKGNFYKVLGIAKHSETGEELVIYQWLHPSEPPSNDIRARPKAMFLSLVDKEKYPEVHQKYRFQLVRDAENNEGLTISW